MVMDKLTFIYHEAVYLLLLMYKNCSTENEWNQLISQATKDIELLDDRFFTRMKLFDITSSTDTLLINKSIGERLKWYEYLELKYDSHYNEWTRFF